VQSVEVRYDEVHRCRGSPEGRYRCSAEEVQQRICRGAEVLMFRYEDGVQWWCRVSLSGADVLMYRSADVEEVQSCRVGEVQVQVQVQGSGCRR